MDNELEPVPLIERLRVAATAWAACHDASLARLGRLVMNDNGFFSRIETNPVTTTATLERFAKFLADAANWPDGVIAVDAMVFAHVTGISPDIDHHSTGQIKALPGHSVAPAPFGAAEVGERGTRVALPGGGRA
jgi:hypothetical protein